MIGNKKSIYVNIISKIISFLYKNNEVILLGDNRDNSMDSRFWGALPENRIIGKMVYKL